MHVMDLMPTLCDVAQANYPKNNKGVAIQPPSGQSILPVLRGGTLADRDLCFEHEGARALRHGDWKIVWGKRSTTPISWELYNLTSDPVELVDLASQYPDLVQAMSARWSQWADLVGVHQAKTTVP